MNDGSIPSLAAMKIISLNTWGARAGLENLLRFLKSHKDADIFCLQEIWSHGGGDIMLGKTAGGELLEGVTTALLQKIEEILPDHTMYFRPHFYDFYGLAMFVKKDIEVVEEGETFVYKDRGYISEEEAGNHARNIQYVTIKNNDQLKTIINFHGLWNGKGKNDSEDRLIQSDNILNFIKNLSHPFIICGDFNLRPDTNSIKKFEDFGLRNLIKEYGITSTRTSLYRKTSEKFADYTLVSKGIKVVDFGILKDVVSDHTPMYLEFETIHSLDKL